MVQILSRDEQRVLRAFGGWMLADLLMDPDHFTPGIGGKSDCDALGDPTHWLGFDGKGVRVGPLGGEDMVEVKWSAAKRYARTIDPGLRARIVANHKARQKHMASFRRWKGTADGPIEDWVENVERPYYAEKADLNDELTILLDEALPKADNLCRCSAMRLAHLAVAGLCDVS